MIKVMVVHPIARPSRKRPAGVLFVDAGEFDVAKRALAAAGTQQPLLLSFHLTALSKLQLLIVQDFNVHFRFFNI